MQFKFDECYKEEEDPPSDNAIDNDEQDEDVDKNQQMFYFVDVPSFVSLFTGHPAEPLYFAKVVEKGAAVEDMKDVYGHVIHNTGELYFQGNYLKLTKSRALNYKKFQLLPTNVLFPPDEIYDTYVDIDFELQLNINIYNSLISKSNYRLKTAHISIYSLFKLLFSITQTFWNNFFLICSRSL